MSIFKNIFGKSEESSQNKIWIPLENEADLEEAIYLSYERKVLIFKHSTRCGVSRMVLKKFENEMGLKKDDVGFYFLDLLAHRDLSGKIAQKFRVEHQSPQMIVLQNGKAIANASHNEISVRLI